MKAIICDRCKKTFTRYEQIESRTKNSTSLFNMDCFPDLFELCPGCYAAFKEEFLGMHEETEEKEDVDEKE